MALKGITPIAVDKNIGICTRKSIKETLIKLSFHFIRVTLRKVNVEGEMRKPRGKITFRYGIRNH